MFEKLVESILYKPPPSSAAAIEWGTSHEGNARETILMRKSQHSDSYQVSQTGIFINTEHPWLAATLDGVVHDPSEPGGHHNGLLEIKCPYSARNKSLTDACKELDRFCCTILNDKVTLKTTHNYYYQIQGLSHSYYGVICTSGHPMVVTLRELNAMTSIGRKRSTQSFTVFIIIIFYQN